MKTSRFKKRLVSRIAMREANVLVLTTFAVLCLEECGRFIFFYLKSPLFEEVNEIRIVLAVLTGFLTLLTLWFAKKSYDKWRYTNDRKVKNVN